MDTAKLFNNGRSQAVRLPKTYRFEGDEVLIKRVGRVGKTRSARNRAALEGFLLPLEIADFGLDAAMAYGNVRTGVEAKGTPAAKSWESQLCDGQLGRKSQ